MSATAPDETPRVAERPNYLNTGYGVKSWLLTIDHKRIAILYLIGVTFFFAIGGLYAAAIRLELLTPAGDVFQSETYNKLFTTHGVMMVFFFMIPGIPGVLGNWARASNLPPSFDTPHRFLLFRYGSPKRFETGNFLAIWTGIPGCGHRLC